MSSCSCFILPTRFALQPSILSTNVNSLKVLVFSAHVQRCERERESIKMKIISGIMWTHRYSIYVFVFLLALQRKPMCDKDGRGYRKPTAWAYEHGVANNNYLQ